MSKTQKKGRGLTLGLGVLQVLIGLGAVAGGLGLIVDPTGASLGLPVEWLSGSPFPDHLIPDIVLLGVNGLGNLAGSLATFVGYRRAGEIAVALGAFLILWIVAQVGWIGLSSGLQPLCFALGGVELVLELLLRRAWHRVR